MSNEQTANAPAPVKQQVIKTKEFLSYKFTEDELKEKSQALARVTQEKAIIEDEKKAVTSQFKAHIEAKEAEINTLATQINQGSEFRYVETVIIHNKPQPGIKTMMRTDTDDIVWVKNMTEEEMQLELDFDVRPEDTVTHSVADDNNLQDLPPFV